MTRTWINLTEAEHRDGKESRPNGLDCVREAARRDRKLRFTALLHHVLTATNERLNSWYSRKVAISRSTQR
jgi:hypothetical protein